MVLGLVRKKKPRVMWKRDIDVMSVLDVMSAMAAVVTVVLWM
jgi:hypothetical protein